MLPSSLAADQIVTADVLGFCWAVGYAGLTAVVLALVSDYLSSASEASSAAYDYFSGV